uniref:Uncharacterized protein n=1 Tax=Cyprinus carpio TaxID=7962 RepID=A0A8C2I3Y8_CYPCA
IILKPSKMKGSFFFIRTDLEKFSIASLALHKLASQYLKRECSGAPSEEQRDSRNVWANYRNQISDPVKTFRAQKDLQLKKVNTSRDTLH